MRNFLNMLYESMPRRMKAVMEAREGHTKYFFPKRSVFFGVNSRNKIDLTNVKLISFENTLYWANTENCTEFFTNL